MLIDIYIFVNCTYDSLPGTDSKLMLVSTNIKFDKCDTVPGS